MRKPIVLRLSGMMENGALWAQNEAQLARLSGNEHEQKTYETELKSDAENMRYARVILATLAGVGIAVFVGYAWFALYLVLPLIAFARLVKREKKEIELKREEELRLFRENKLRRHPRACP